MRWLGPARGEQLQHLQLTAGQRVRSQPGRVRAPAEVLLRRYVCRRRPAPAGPDAPGGGLFCPVRRSWWLIATRPARCSIRVVLMVMIACCGRSFPLVPAAEWVCHVDAACPWPEPDPQITAAIRAMYGSGRRSGRWRWRSGTGWASGWPMRISRLRSGSGAGRAGLPSRLALVTVLLATRCRTW